MSLNKVNNIWKLYFTQANCYSEKMFKTNDEYANGIVKMQKSNMKKITISQNSMEELLVELNHENTTFPIFISGFKIFKKDIINFYHELRIKLLNHLDWFRGEGLAFLIDKEIYDSTNKYFEGAIKIAKRDENRNEIVISFGEFSNNTFIDSKNSKFPFNHIIFICAFDRFAYLEINYNDKIIKPMIDIDNVLKLYEEKPITEIRHRKTGKK